MERGRKGVKVDRQARAGGKNARRKDRQTGWKGSTGERERNKDVLNNEETGIYN